MVPANGRLNFFPRASCKVRATDDHVCDQGQKTCKWANAKLACVAGPWDIQRTCMPTYVYDTCENRSYISRFPGRSFLLTRQKFCLESAQDRRLRALEASHSRKRSLSIPLNVGKRNEGMCSNARCSNTRHSGELAGASSKSTGAASHF